MGAPGMERLPATKGSLSKRQSGGDDRPATRSRSRRSPHRMGRLVYAVGLEVGCVSAGIQAQSGTESNLLNRQPLVRRVCDDHGKARRGYREDKEKPAARPLVADYQCRGGVG